MDNKQENQTIFTIPNILSIVRLCLIPLLVWLYHYQQNYSATLIVLLVSGATDVIDGIIARKFNMISDLGKALDPIADKLTQLAMLACLVGRFPYMILPFGILIVKEILAATINLLAIKKTRIVNGAVWHGKLNTVLLYSMMVLHLIWYGIPQTVSKATIEICTAVMLVSAVLYTIRGIQILTGKQENN